MSYNRTEATVVSVRVLNGAVDVDMIVNFDWFSKERFQLIPGTVIEIYPIEEKKSKDRRL